MLLGVQYVRNHAKRAISREELYRFRDRSPEKLRYSAEAAAVIRKAQNGNALAANKTVPRRKDGRRRDGVLRRAG